MWRDYYAAAHSEMARKVIRQTICYTPMCDRSAMPGSIMRSQGIAGRADRRGESRFPPRMHGGKHRAHTTTQHTLSHARYHPWPTWMPQASSAGYADQAHGHTGVHFTVTRGALRQIGTVLVLYR